MSDKPCCATRTAPDNGHSGPSPSRIPSRQFACLLLLPVPANGLRGAGLCPRRSMPAHPVPHPAGQAPSARAKAHYPHSTCGYRRRAPQSPRATLPPAAAALKPFGPAVRTPLTTLFPIASLNGGHGLNQRPGQGLYGPPCPATLRPQHHSSSKRDHAANSRFMNHPS